MTVKNIFDFLESKFPTNTACDFDNVGILVGDANAEVTKALIALDCTALTVEEAINNGCNLIITHHQKTKRLIIMHKVQIGLKIILQMNK